MTHAYVRGRMSVLHPTPPPLACVLPIVCRYNEKADVYSYGILVWFVAQYLHLCYNPHLWSDRKEFMTLMRPYDKGEATTVLRWLVASPACECLLLLTGASSHYRGILTMPTGRELSGCGLLWTRLSWARQGGGGCIHVCAGVVDGRWALRLSRAYATGISHFAGPSRVPEPLLECLVPLVPSPPASLPGLPPLPPDQTWPHCS